MPERLSSEEFRRIYAKPGQPNIEAESFKTRQYVQPVIAHESSEDQLANILAQFAADHEMVITAKSIRFWIRQMSASGKL